MKRIVTTIFLIFLFLPFSFSFAEAKSYLTEGHYIMNETDTIAMAEEICLLQAKYLAIQEACKENHIDNKLTMDQVALVSKTVLKFNVLDKKREMIGKDIVFTVKIKSEILIEKLIELLNNPRLINEPAIISKDRAIIAAIILYDDFKPVIKDSKGQSFIEEVYDIKQYNELPDPIRRVLYEKFNTRFSTLEINDEIKQKFLKLVTANNTQKITGNNINKNIDSEFAKENKYDYIFTIVFKTNLMRRIIRFSGKDGWVIELEFDIKLYDNMKNDFLYSKTVVEKVEYDYTRQVFLLYMDVEGDAKRGCAGALDVLGKRVATLLNKDLVSFEPKNF
jgi:hypothetical protein